MTGDLRIVLVAPFTDMRNIESLVNKIEQTIKIYAPEFRIDRTEYLDVAQRPAEQMMIDQLIEIGKKLDNVRLSQENNQ
jgi:hypothetical protein